MNLIIKRLEIFTVFLFLIGSASAKDQPLSNNQVSNLALSTFNEVQKKCAGKCYEFFLLNFKNELINSFNWTQDFAKKLYEDVKWAKENNCTSDASVDGLVEIFVADEYSYSFHKNPKCLFKRFKSLDPHYPQAKATYSVQNFQTVPSTHYLHSDFNTYAKGPKPIVSRYTIKKKARFIPGRPFYNSLRAADRILERTLNVADGLFGYHNCDSNGIDVGGGKYGQSFYSTSGIDVGGGKYGPACQFSEGIDVGGGKFGAENSHGGQQQGTFNLLESRNKLNAEISKASVFRDVVVQKELGYEVLYKDHIDYWKHYGITQDELRYIINGPTSSELLEKVEELEKKRQEIEEKLANISKDGNSFFSQYEKDKVNREFIFLLSSKILE